MVNLSTAIMDKGSKEGFIAFIKSALTDKAGTDAIELYYFLVKCFIDADADRDGSVNPVEFDQMIEQANSAPRRYGLAPTTASLYGSPQKRLEARSAQFKNMDANGDGKISLDEWLEYCMKHIIEKVSKI